MTLAFLGEIKLSILRVKGLEVSDSWRYAEHAVVEGRPRLQHTGKGLREGSIDVALRAEHGDPDAMHERLIALADRGEAAPLLRGDGADLGRFVITKLSDAPSWTFADGKPITVTLRISLKEFVGREQPRPQGEATNAGSPLARRPARDNPPPGDPADVPVAQIVRRGS